MPLIDSEGLLAAKEEACSDDPEGIPCEILTKMHEDLCDVTLTQAAIDRSREGLDELLALGHYDTDQYADMAEFIDEKEAGL